MHTLSTIVLTLLATSTPIKHLPIPQDPPAGVEAIVNQIATQALEEAMDAQPDSLSADSLLLAGDTISPLDTMTFTDPAVYDSLLTQWQEQSSVAAFETFISEFINIDSTYQVVTNIPDSVYAERLSKILSPLPMKFNDVVKRHIVSYTTTN